LLAPSGRTPSYYRVYTPADVERLERIVAYRDAGLSLDEIRAALGARPNTVAGILAARLAALGEQISQLREQQRILTRMLGSKVSAAKTPVLDKSRWIEILRASGMSDADMERWHVEFERLAPAAHAEFLASLGVPTADIETIRRKSRSGARRRDDNL